MIEIMNKYKTIDENKNEIEQFYSAEKFEYKEKDYLIKQINNLQRYECVNGDLVDNDLIQAQDGIYIRLEDVLEIFSRENR